MTRMLLGLLVCTVSAVACSRSPAPEGSQPGRSGPEQARRSGLEASSFDPAVRAQDDLFTHVNGGWLARTEIPSDKAAYGTFNALIDRSQSDLRAILEEAANATAQARDADSRKIGDLYASFVDEAKAESLGAAPLAPELAAIDALSTKSDLARYLARAFKLGIISPVVGGVDGDAGEPGREILYVYQGGLGLPDRDYYFSTDPKMRDYRLKYQQFLATILTLGGQPGPDAAAKGIVDLETRLAKAHWTRVESRDAVKTYNKVAVPELATQFPGFDWSTWIAELGISTVPASVVSQPSYLKAFAATVAAVPVERWKPYLKAALINGLAPYLNRAFVDAEFGFYGTTLRGVPENEPRWKRAVTLTDRYLGEALGKLYVERHFQPEAKARMDQLVANMRAAFAEGITRLEWMSPETKGQAQDKLARFRPKIGYPVKWRDYSQVAIGRDDLVGNVMRASVAESEYQLAKAGKPIDPEQWSMTPQTVNAYYHPTRNEIVFPAAILQPPFFTADADDAVNYGAIGAVIGHEMGHGFDDQGRRYDGSGLLRDWWTAKDAEEYTRRAQVLVEQYNAFEPLPGVKVNGALTLGENIGDLTGLVIAHRAYRLSLGGKPAPTIDGMTGDQRFFAGWAQAWRSKRRDDSLRQQVVVDPHAPEPFRANGAVRNVPEFYEAFGVKEGDRMFLPPGQRVTIW